MQNIVCGLHADDIDNAYWSGGGATVTNQIGTIHHFWRRNPISHQSLGGVDKRYEPSVEHVAVLFFLHRDGYHADFDGEFGDLREGLFRSSGVGHYLSEVHRPDQIGEVKRAVLARPSSASSVISSTVTDLPLKALCQAIWPPRTPEPMTVRFLILDIDDPYCYSKEIKSVGVVDILSPPKLPAHQNLADLV